MEIIADWNIEIEVQLLHTCHHPYAYRIIQRNENQLIKCKYQFYPYIITVHLHYMLIRSKKNPFSEWLNAEKEKKSVYCVVESYNQTLRTTRIINAMCVHTTSTSHRLSQSLHLRRRHQKTNKRHYPCHTMEFIFLGVDWKNNK